MKNKIFCSILVLTTSASFAIPSSGSTGSTAGNVSAYMTGQFSCGFPGVNNFFSALTGLTGQIQESLQAFSSQEETFNTILDYYSQIKSHRETTFSCMLTKFASYQAALEECQYQQTYASINIDADKAILQNKLLILQGATSAEISGLQTDVNLLKANIDALASDYATLTNMSDANVEEAVSILNTYKNDYDAMVLQRTAFLSALNTFMSGLTGEESSETTALSTLKSDYSC
ncbi:MAG: hypothetical protein NTZ68_04060 [Candidatus Dependentiae bacterium]|nr:hypothetical protein [Candidatus Dependentiae bacterium]